MTEETKQSKIDRLVAAGVANVPTDPEQTNHKELDELLAAAGTTTTTETSEAEAGLSGGVASGAIASREANAELEHSDTGTTTRADQLDAGVPMEQGDPSEPTGPEDAFGEGPKRGDYSQRTETGPHAESVPAVNAGQPIKRWVYPDGRDAKPNASGASEVTVDYAPNATLVDQTQRAADQGEVPGVKGGVAT